jgi:hypothetical protein
MRAPDRRQICLAGLALAATPALAAFGFDELMATLAQRQTGSSA